VNETQGLYMPDAKDLSALDVDPRRELQSCNSLLDDQVALHTFYDENGYLLLRQVLDAGSVVRARNEMLAVAARLGLVEPGDETGRWTGKAIAPRLEESPDFAGISRRLVEHPKNLRVLERVLGERACLVPIVQYRIYPPHGPVTVVHQDGFYSPGIQDYKPVWIPLLPCPRAAGGLMIAIGQNRRGYLHNLAKPTPFPVPVGVIDDDSWATTDYEPGDALIVHPRSPHASRPNTTDRLRVSFDTRVQSAARPSAIAGTVTKVDAGTVTVDSELVGSRTLRVDAETFLRPLDPGIREPFERFADVVRPGQRLVVVMDGDRAVMLRKAAEG
jgi:ectoine hydroxylase-related dioxygenase (phytanoyl-CoA dioxygenase family)